MTETGSLQGLTKKTTKKFMKELTDDLNKLFPHAKDPQGNLDHRLLAAWYRLYSVFAHTLEPHPNSAVIKLDERCTVTLKSTTHWAEDDNTEHIDIVTYDDKGDTALDIRKQLTKKQLLTIHAFTSSALAHYDK